MIPTVSVSQMKAVDDLMVNGFYVKLDQMMENAGRLLALFAIEQHPQARHFTILCGKGNNGADGLVAARYLHNRGKKCTVVLADTIKDDVAHLGKTLNKLSVPLTDTIPIQTEVFLDCLLGYSTRGAPRGKVKDLMEETNRTGKPIISLDIPSGIDPDTGEVYQPSFAGSVCLTLALPKQGIINNCREIYIADLGIPPEVYQKLRIIVPRFFMGAEVVKFEQGSSQA